jgi:uncharacterized protein HemX
MDNNVMEAIDALVEEKTFTGAALEGIVAVRKKAEEQERIIVELEHRAELRKSDISRLEEQAKKDDAHIRHYQEREALVENREAKMAELEKSTAVAEARFHVASDMFRTIFGEE